jgi:hypothetical protein
MPTKRRGDIKSNLSSYICALVRCCLQCLENRLVKEYISNLSSRSIQASVGGPDFPFHLLPYMDDYYLCFVRDVASSGYSIAKSQLSALPTTSDIRECKNVLWETCTSKIVAVNDDTIVKYRNCINTREGGPLVCLDRHVPLVPVPRLHTIPTMTTTRNKPSYSCNTFPACSWTLFGHHCRPLKSMTCSPNSNSTSTQCEE